MIPHETQKIANPTVSRKAHKTTGLSHSHAMSGAKTGGPTAIAIVRCR